MRVPVAWLRSYCDPGTSAAEIADALTMSGDKLERLHRFGVPDSSGFVVGRVLEAERHPNADRLSVCVVDDGSGERAHDRVRRPERGGRPDGGGGAAGRHDAGRQRARRGEAARGRAPAG